MKSFLIKFALLYFTLVTAQNTDDFSWVKPTDLFEFYYLEARFVRENNSTDLSTFNSFRAGVGFADMNSGRQVTVEFLAINGVLSSIFPEWVQTDNGVVPTWQNQYGISATQGSFSEHWTAMYLVGYINGSTFLDYICWLPTYSQSPNLQYELFTVQSTPNAQSAYIDSSSCVDFTWISFQVLFDLGAEFINDSTIPPTRDYVYLYSTKPEIVSYSANENSIQAFYNVFFWKPTFQNESFAQLMQGTRAAFNNSFYYYYYGQYYSFTLIPPYYTIESVVVPLNNGIRSPKNVVLNCYTPPPPTPLEKNELSGGWIFIIIVLCGFTVYFGAGIAWNVKKGKRGAEAVPNIAFWTDLPGLVRDGAKWVVSKLSGNRAREQYEKF